MPTLSESIQRALRWSERYTKTDLAYLFTGGSWLTFAQLTLGVIAFGLSIVFAHFVSKDDYGTYRYLLSIFWTLTAFSLTGLPTALVQAVARGFEGMYKQAVSISILGGVPITVISVGMAIYYFMHGNMVIGYGSLIIAVAGPLIQPSFLFGSFLEGKRDFKRMALYGIALNLFASLLILIAIFFTKNPLIFFVAYLTGNIIGGVILCIYTYYQYRPNDKKSERFFSISGHFSLMNILTTVSAQIDKLLVFHYLGAAQLAVYTFAIALPEQAKSFANSIGTLAFPKFARRTIEDIESNFWKRLLLFTLALIPVTLLYIFSAPLLFHIFFPVYAGAIFYSQLYALSLIFISNTIPPTLLQAHVANKELYIFNIVTPIFQIGSLVILTAMFGIIGTIWARIIGRAFTLVLGAILVRMYATA